jgi:peptidyl-tRNA hydrolase, PTH1 family
MQPKALIGLGNPDLRYARTRHNIGFQVIDALATAHGGQWQRKRVEEVAYIQMHDANVILIKPQTYMNNSGDVVPFLKKEGIQPIEVLVIHDELELPFGKIASKVGGSAKGHNGLKSIIQAWGTAEFGRLRIGIGRPVHKEDVAQYVLQPFDDQAAVQKVIDEAVTVIEKLYP